LLDILTPWIVVLAGSFLILIVGMAVHPDPPKPDAREHPLRRRLFDLILRRPGIRLVNLWKELDSNRKTTKYHLMVLERADLIASVEGPKVVRYFPAKMSPAQRPRVALLLRGRILEMARMVQREPGISQVELGKALTMSRKVLREYADLLVEHHLV
jgi:predicted transcriptional regulator